MKKKNPLTNRKQDYELIFKIDPIFVSLIHLVVLKLYEVNQEPVSPLDALAAVKTITKFRNLNYDHGFWYPHFHWMISKGYYTKIPQRRPMVLIPTGKAYEIMNDMLADFQQLADGINKIIVAFK